MVNNKNDYYLVFHKLGAVDSLTERSMETSFVLWWVDSLTGYERATFVFRQFYSFPGRHWPYVAMFEILLFGEL
jgi:hypothetical protein